MLQAMPIDPEVKAILDAIQASLTPEALGKILAPVLEAHGAGVLAKVPKGLDQAGLDAALAKFKPTEPEVKGKDPKAGDSPEIVAMRAELAATNARLEATEKSRQETATKAAQERARSEVKAALGRAGVAADGLDDALAVVERTGSLVLDGDKVGWKQPNKFNPVLEEVVSFEDGARAWASTPSGKRYQAPIDQRGTGDRTADRTGAGQSGTASLASLRGDASILNGLMAAQS